MSKKKPSVEASALPLMSVPAFWPMAMATAMVEEGTELLVRNDLDHIVR